MVFIIRTSKRIVVISLLIFFLSFFISLIFEFGCYRIDYIVSLSLGFVTGSIFSFVTAYIEYAIAYNSIYDNIKIHFSSLKSDFSIIKRLKNSYKDVEELKKYLNLLYSDSKTIYYNGCEFYPITYKTKKGKLLLLVHKFIFNFYFKLFGDFIHINEYGEDELKNLVCRSLDTFEKYENDFKTISEEFTKIEKNTFKKVKNNSKEDDLTCYKHKW